MDAPKCKEVSISVTTGGTVQLVKFNLQNEFSFSVSETYDIPHHWSDEEIEQWRTTTFETLKAKIDALAQDEQDALLESADWYDAK